MPDATTAALTGDTQQTQATTTAAATTSAVTTETATTTATQATTEAAKSWPDDWRKQMVGEDDKELKQAERYASPKDIWKKARELERRLSSGELLKPLPDNASPEQIAESRAARGIPDQPAAYLEKLPNGLVIGEDDKPIFESLVKKLHEGNADPKTVHGIVEWYNNFREESLAEQAEADKSHRTETEDALRTEWGADYRANVNHVKAFLETAPEGIADRIANARDGEERALLNDPKVVQWLAQIAREINPIHTIVPGTSGNDAQTVDGEIEKIEKLMRTNRVEYNRDNKMQERYRNLIDARIKIQQRGKAA